jgi:hypothetical protein
MVLGSTKGGNPTTPVTVKDTGGALIGGTFIVDTGASESMISSAIAITGAFKIVGTVVAGTAAGAATLPKVKGGGMTFNVVPKGGGAEKPATCNLPMSVGAANLLGMDQLIEVSAKLEWDPVNKKGSITGV